MNGTVTIAEAGPYPYTSPMTATLIGYARCPTDRLARSVPDARAIADQLRQRGVKLALGRTLYDPDDPMGKLFFNILATFATTVADLTGGVCNGIGGLWLGGAVSTTTRTG